MLSSLRLNSRPQGIKLRVVEECAPLISNLIKYDHPIALSGNGKEAIGSGWQLLSFNQYIRPERYGRRLIRARQMLLNVSFLSFSCGRL